MHGQEQEQEQEEEQEEEQEQEQEEEQHLRATPLAHGQMRLRKPLPNLHWTSKRQKRFKATNRPPHLPRHLLRGAEHVQQPLAALVPAVEASHTQNKTQNLDKNTIKHRCEVRGGAVASVTSA